MSRPTIASLQEEIRQLRPYEELFFTTSNLNRWKGKHRLTSAKGARVPTVITLYGPGRSSGGIIVEGDSVRFAEAWAYDAERSSCCYRQAVARDVRQIIRESV